MLSSTSAPGPAGASAIWSTLAAALEVRDDVETAAGSPLTAQWHLITHTDSAAAIPSAQPMSSGTRRQDNLRLRQMTSLPIGSSRELSLWTAVMETRYSAVLPRESSA